jgi:hemerythrin superfamily protein
MTLKSKVRVATHAMAEALAAADPNGDDGDILKTLKNEHNEVKALLAELADAQGTAARRNLVKRIRKALVPHTKAEQKVVYDPVIALRSKEAQEDGYEGYLEHELASSALTRLVSIRNATSPEHHATGKVLKELVEHHIREEESALWSDVKSNFSDEQRAEMNTDFLAAKRRVRVAA